MLQYYHDRYCYNHYDYHYCYRYLYQLFQVFDQTAIGGEILILLSYQIRFSWEMIIFQDRNEMRDS